MQLDAAESWVQFSTRYNRYMFDLRDSKLHVSIITCLKLDQASFRPYSGLLVMRY
jgi:hypothetical protein